MKNQTALLLAVVAFVTGSALADEPAPKAKQAAQAEVVVEAAAEGQVIRVRAKQVVVQAVAEAEDAKEAVEDATEQADGKPEAAAGEAEDKAATEKELREKMLELQKQLQDTRNEFQQKANEQRNKAKQDALKALDDINLPKDPTRKQCEAYVEELRKACEGRRSFSSNDPATKKLQEIPVEHYDLLVTEMANRTSLRYYANYAMREFDPEQLRERFVASIGDNPNNIGIIVMHGWVEDVRPQIIEYVKSADSSISPGWFQAAVELDEPTLYPKLHEFATQSRQAIQFIKMLEMLPDYDLAHTVDVCWRRAKEGKLSVNHSTFAAKAAEYGNVDALGMLVDQLRSSSSYMSHSSTYNIRRINVLRFIDYRGSNTDIQEWYKKNKDELVFDQLRKRFILPEAF